MGIAEISSCLTLLSMKIQEEIERLKSKLDGIDSSELLLAIHQLIEDHSPRPDLVSEPKSTYEKRSDILGIALKLSPSDRADLAQRLLDSLDELEMETEWFDLAEKRLAEIENGEVETLSWATIRNAVSHGA